MSLRTHVNVFQGTDSIPELSTGNTLPIVAVPFGMAHWTLQTQRHGGWMFSPRNPKLQGVRCTHQPSPWMGDYGSFAILPQSGRRLLSASRRATIWRRDHSTVSPDSMSLRLAARGIDIDVAPTSRCAVMRFRFPTDTQHRIIVESTCGETHLRVEPDRRTIVGFTRGNSGGVPDGFAQHFVAVLDHDIVDWATFHDDALGPAQTPRTDEGLGLVAELGPGARVVTMRIATSFIGEAQARITLKREVGGRDLEAVAADAAHLWDTALDQIEVEPVDDGASDPTATIATFASCLYRTKLFPRVLHEMDAQNRTIHYSPYDGEVHPGVLYADTGTWDTYRTQFPLLTLLDPAFVGQVLQGFVHAGQESGWLPQWPSPGHRVSMPGTHLDAIVADALVKGVNGFDVDAAYRMMLRHADGPAGENAPGGAGRRGIEEYLHHGCRTSGTWVAETLDYAYDDWAISVVADRLGDDTTRDRMLRRATNYRNVFDPAVGFMRARGPDGTWREPFDEFEWGGPYCEGGAWQSSWAVPHDPAGLGRLFGGSAALAAKLDDMLATPPYFAVGSYGHEIHEMTEMAAANHGQYAHSNQPVHNALFLYLAAGRPWRTQTEVRRVLETMYSPEGFPGDEDNGEMAAWYVLGALGIYPHCPGRPEWALGSPLMRRTTVHLPGDRDLVLDAPDNSTDRHFVESMTISSHRAQYRELVVPHATLIAGTTVHWGMSDRPRTQIVPVDARLSSMSEYVD
ncbi:GH92 family glycosyl hydrolase [Gordonia sp. CPCC 205515]|uniref:GH92 family glycosyl hydrolase n=1 Tax=Gordonia sp. CPCC 205515 TaxID=3140791 RepID=UPI003AF38874